MGFGIINLQKGWGTIRARSKADEGRKPISYCRHPYSAFERESNENGNRMIRRQIPKERIFAKITEDETLQVKRWVNEYPHGILKRRCTGRVLLEVAKEAKVEGVELLL